MEGSVAAAGQGQGANGDAGADAGGGQDVGALAQSISAISEGQQELRDLVTQMAEQAQQAPGGDAGAGDGDGISAEGLDFGLLEGDGTGEVDPAKLNELLTGFVKQQAEALIAPLRQQVAHTSQTLQDNLRTQELQALVDEFPEFGENDGALAKQTMKAAETMAEAFGWPKGLSQDPRMWKVVYMAGKAADLANAEGDGSDSSVATLEGGGGARPAGSGQQQYTADHIVGARKGKSALPFG